MNEFSLKRVFSSACLAFLVLALVALPSMAAGDQPLEASLEGIVSVAVADYVYPDKDGRMTGYSRMQYTVRVSEFEFVDLDGDPELLDSLKTGERVVLSGERETPKLFRASKVISREAGPDMFAEKSLQGEQDLAVIPVRFPNLDFASNCQFDTINQIAITGPTSAVNYWEEVSYGKMTFSAISKTFDEVTINNDYEGFCDLNVWTAQADAVIGAEINSYNRRVYTFPSALQAVCPFGLGQVGNEGTGLTLSWVTGCNSADAYLHELGHNFTLRHAWTVSTEYGDTGDIMGFGGVGVRKLNGPHVDFLNWLPDGEPHFKTLSGIGIYNETLTALGRDYETEPNPTQVLKIFSPSLGKDLYVSYRDNHGMDATLGTGYQYKTHVHTQRQLTESTLLRVLSTNETYTVGPDGISIAQVGTNPAAGTVNVRVIIETPNDCEEFTPEATVASQDRIYAAPGGTINYTMDITNQDGDTCLPLEMRISGSLPPQEGWTANQPIEIAASPGETVSPVLSVTSPVDAIGSNFTLSLIITAPADIQNEHTVVLNATYRIDRLPPTPPDGLYFTGGTEDSASMFWETTSTDTQSGLGYYEILRSFGDENFSFVGQASTADYVDSAANGDLLFYLVRAVDNAGNVSD